jgi:hypothetical protein
MLMNATKCEVWIISLSARDLPNVLQWLEQIRSVAARERDEMKTCGK